MKSCTMTTDTNYNASTVREKTAVLNRDESAHGNLARGNGTLDNGTRGNTSIKNVGYKDVDEKVKSDEKVEPDVESSI